MFNRKSDFLDSFTYLQFYLSIYLFFKKLFLSPPLFLSHSRTPWQASFLSLYSMITHLSLPSAKAPPSLPSSRLPRAEVGIYKRKQESKKARKHALDHESDQQKKK